MKAIASHSFLAIKYSQRWQRKFSNCWVDRSHLAARALKSCQKVD